MAQETQVLTKDQISFLNLVGEKTYLTKRFYFTGGTVLAAFYLEHRLSEDTDLFSEEEINIVPIRAFIRDIQAKLKIKKIDYRQYLCLHSFQLYFSKTNILKNEQSKRHSC